MANYPCKKFSPQPTICHGTSVIDRQRTDENHAQPLLKYCQWKTNGWVIVIKGSGTFWKMLQQLAMYWRKL